MSETRGSGGVFSNLEMRGETNIPLSLFLPPPSPSTFWLFKSRCPWCLSASLSLCCSWRGFLSTLPRVSQPTTGTELNKNKPQTTAYLALKQIGTSWTITYSLLLDNVYLAGNMLLYPDLLALLFLQLALSSPWTLASRLPPLSGGNPSSKGSQVARAPTQRQQSGELSTTVLALGEPCGVYTLSCARGLRCTPPLGSPSPLQALLQGRGVCSNASGPSPSERPQPTGKHLLQQRGRHHSVTCIWWGGGGVM